MVKRPLYVCRECNYVFPEELAELIDKRVQVFCEMCGTPFSLAGVEFKQPQIIKREKSSIQPKAQKAYKKDKTSLSKAINVFNSFDYIPLIIFAGIVLGMLFGIFLNPDNWFTILSRHLLIAIAAILIVVYDLNHISPRIKEEKYGESNNDDYGEYGQDE